MSTDELLDTLFEGRPHALAPVVAAWLASSRRFAQFARDHHTKIRKKLRAVQDPESIRDLHLELETAYQFTLAKDLTPVYEPATGASRGPDFAVRFTTSLEFMVEVTRLRAESDTTTVPEPERAESNATTAPEPERAKAIDDELGRGTQGALSERRLAGILAAKLGQTVTGRVNLLIIGLDAPPPSADELDAALRRIRRRVETSDADAIRRQGFTSRGNYLRRAETLSAILVRPAPDPSREPRPAPPPRVALWSNPRAAVPLPTKVRSAVLRVVATSTEAHRHVDARP